MSDWKSMREEEGKRDKVELELPNIKVKGEKSITIFEIGNLSEGIVPTKDDLERWRDLIKQASEIDDMSHLIVPEGLVTVKKHDL